MITKRKLLTTKTLSLVTLLVVVAVVVCSWLVGLEQNRSLFANALLSTTVLSGMFFLFLTVGLYYGIKLKDDIGKLTQKVNKVSFPDISAGLELPEEIPAVGDGLAEIIVGVIAWIIFSFLLLLLIWLFGAMVWVTIILFAAMLYWIFFRALRLVFRNRNVCQGKPTDEYDIWSCLHDFVQQLDVCDHRGFALYALE